MIFAFLLAALQSETVDSLIDRLGSDDIEVREEASARLKKVGASARPALFKALNSSDAEVLARAGDLLRSIPGPGETTRIWRLENSDPEQVAGVLRGLPFPSGPPEIATDLRTRSVIVRATTAELDFVSRVIADLDRSTTVRVYVFRGCGDSDSVARVLQQLLERPDR